MAGDTVTTIFGGDDSAFAAAAARVKSLMAGIAGFQPELKFFEGGKKAAEGLEHAAHGASGAIHGITAAFGPLAAGLAALAGVATVVEGFKRSLEEAAKDESAKFAFENIAGGAETAEAAIRKLEQLSKETATDFPELVGPAKSLMQAGLNADEAADATERLQKIALNTGADFNELGDIYARVQTKQEVSAKDLVKLAMAGIPGVAELGHQFRELEQQTTDANKAIEETEKNLERAFEQNERNVGGINSFATRIGLTKDAFDGFARGIGVSTALAGELGQGFGKITGTLQGEFVQGLQQISKETGVSQSSLLEFAREGKLGYEDLIQAAARLRKEQEEKAIQENEAQKLANENNLLQQQRSLVAQVSQAIKSATDEGGIFSNLNKFFQTWNGKLREIAHAVDETFQSFGTPLINALKPALDYLISQGPAIQEMGRGAGEALGGAIKWFIDSLKDGTFWDQVKSQGSAAFDAIFEPVRQFGAQLQQAFAGLNKNNELVQGFQALSNLLDAVADNFGVRLLDAIKGPLQALAEFDVSGRERVAGSWLSKVPGMPQLISPEEQGLTHAERVAREVQSILPTDKDREAAGKEWEEAMQGITTHFPAAMRQGIEAFQTPSDIDRAREEWTRAVTEGRTPFYVKPEQAAADYERQTGQKQPSWMSPETAERVAQLLEMQNSLLRTVLTAGGGA
jgi:hypothetical protein